MTQSYALTHLRSSFQKMEIQNNYSNRSTKLCPKSSNKQMKSSKTVWAEVDDQGDPVRILKHAKQRLQLPDDKVKEFSSAEAVRSIRLKVFGRAGCTPEVAGACESCGRAIIWERGHFSSGEMHEVIPKGKTVFSGPGGEVSITNSVALCRSCHTGKDGAHGNRHWQTAKLKEEA